jgi:hypothetical protein
MTIMIGALIIFGLCFLGLLACGIVLIVDDIEAKKFAKKLKNFGKIFGITIDKFI